VAVSDGEVQNEFDNELENAGAWWAEAHS
jgi:hypothetical protein